MKKLNTKWKKYEGHLFGHYDSRGGCSFYVGMTREQANGEYLAAFEILDYSKEHEIINNDYLGTATLETDTEPKDGDDIEYRGDDSILWVKFEPIENHQELRIAAECPEGYEEANLGEDAFGVLLITSRTE